MTNENELTCCVCEKVLTDDDDIHWLHEQDCQREKIGRCYCDLYVCAEHCPEPGCAHSLPECINPKCDKKDAITGGPWEGDPENAWQTVHCENCGTEWVEVYKFETFNNVVIRNEHIKPDPKPEPYIDPGWANADDLDEDLAVYDQIWSDF